MTAPERSFSTSELARIAGVRERRVFSYIERFRIGPSIKEAEGTGTRRVWSFDDVLLCSFISLLSNLLEAELLRHVVKFVQDGRNLMSKGKEWRIVAGGTSALEDLMIATRDDKRSEYQVKRVFNSETFDGYIAETSVLTASPDLPDCPVQVVISMTELHEWLEGRIASLHA